MKRSISACIKARSAKQFAQQSIAGHSGRHPHPAFPRAKSTERDATVF